MVSTDLLTVPKDAADEKADVLLKPTTNIVGNTSLSAVSRPNVAGEDIESPNIASMPLEYPEASNATADNPSTYKNPKDWPADHELHELRAFDYGQPQGEAGILPDLPFNHPGEIAPLTLDTGSHVNLIGAAPATIPPVPLIPSVVLHGSL